MFSMTYIFQNMFFYVIQEKDSHLCLELYVGDYIMTGNKKKN